MEEGNLELERKLKPTSSDRNHISDILAKLVEHELSREAGIVLGPRSIASASSLIIGTPIANYRDGYCIKGDDGKYLIVSYDQSIPTCTQVELRKKTE